MAENKHRVAKRQWMKWTDEQQLVFNGVYDEIRSIGPGIFCHPDARGMSDEAFDVIAWNAAWIAGEHAREPGKAVMDSETVEPA